MNHQFPETAVGSKIDQWFADEIFKATKGEVEIKIFWSNKLGNPRDNLVLLSRGDIDMAAMSAGYFPSELPHFSAPNSIPMGMDNICQASEIMKAFIDQIPAFAQEAAQRGVQPLFFHVLNPYVLVSKEPITSFAQLKGKRIRSWGNDMPRLISSAEGKPLNLFLPDIYNALKHNVIDACPFSYDLVVSYKLFEVATHISNVVMWEGPGWGVWIGQKAMDKLSVTQRQLFFEIAEKARLKELPESMAAEKQAKEFLKTKGVQFHSFPLKEQEKWKSASPDFFLEFIHKMEISGKGESARQMVELWLSMRNNILCPDSSK